MTNRSQERAPRKWKIIRFELVYFNPRHNRWQLFQEGDAIPGAGNGDDSDKKGEARHRHYIQQLLGALRETFQTAWNSSELPVHCPSRKLEQRTIRFSTNSEPIKKFIQRFREISNHPDELWRLILTYIFSTLDFHGLSKTSDEELQRLIRDPQIEGLMSAAGSAGQSQQSPPVLSRSAARDFLSCLPILEHWDVCGLISPHSCASNDQASASDLQKRLQYFKSAIESDQCFAQHLAFGTEKTNNNQMSRSQRLLGYDVRLELFAKSNNKGAGTKLGPSDFFENCHEPGPNQKGNERALYMAYAYFVDQIQEGLQGDSEAQSPHVYTIWYPIRTLGWNHYLQIYLSPTNLNSGQDDQRHPPSAKDLWIDWSIAQHDLGWNRFMIYLTQQLEFVGLSYFQFEVLQKLKKLSPELASAKGLLAEFGFRLAPLETVSDGKQFWSYVKPYRWPPDRTGDEVPEWTARMNNKWTHFSKNTWPHCPGRPEGDPLEIWVGEQWRPKAAPVSNRSEAPANPTGIGSFFKADGETLPFRAASIHQNGPLPYLDELHRSCVRQMLEEQVEFVEKLASNQAERARKKREMQTQQENALFNLIGSLSVDNLQYWREKLDSVKTVSQFKALRLPTLGGRDELATQLLDGFIDEDSEPNIAQIRAAVIPHLKNTIPLAISEYLGTGPVKVLTHGSGECYYSIAGKSPSEDFPQLFDTLRRRVLEHYGNEANSFPRHLTAQMDKLQKFNTLCMSKTEYKYFDDVQVERQKLRFEGIFPAAKDIGKTGLSFEVDYPIATAFEDAFTYLYRSTCKSCVTPEIVKFSVPLALHPGPSFWEPGNVPKIIGSYYAIRFQSVEPLSYATIKNRIDAIEGLAKLGFSKYGRIWLFYRDNSEWVGVNVSEGKHSLPVNEPSVPVRPIDICLNPGLLPLLEEENDLQVLRQKAERIRPLIFSPHAEPNSCVFLIEFRTWRQ